MENQPPSDWDLRFVGGYCIPLAIARDKLCVALNHEFIPPPDSMDHSGPGQEGEAPTLRTHINNYLAGREDLHPCLVFAPTPFSLGYLVILTHSERGTPEGGGDLEESEHSLKVKEFLLTEGKLDPEDLEWRCMWKDSVDLAEEKLIPVVQPPQAMFWGATSSVDEFLERIRGVH
ncbi:hypothetical protein QCA50_011187 [Cerrena zonata]|uniref:Uncharacterized protein n=1 Tax=Cerrena zonata TaxID=2478898 RepID=A0AAW0FYG4_9APHY